MVISWRVRITGEKKSGVFGLISIPSEILSLSKILFCQELWGKKGNWNKFLTQNWNVRIFYQTCIHYLHNALNKKTCLWNRTFWAFFYKHVRKQLPDWYHICTLLYKILFSKGTPFCTHELSCICTENVSKNQMQ